MPQALNFAPPVISVDVEDWAQSTWDHSLPISERSAVNTQRLLKVLREAGVHATMFVLGKFAERFPDVVKDIRAQGHEIACHGYGHIAIFRQTRQEFGEDVYRAKDILEQIVGERMKGYRAPDFSIIHDTLWALDILAEAGFEYDSSIFPVRQTRYGIADWPSSPVRVRLPSGRSIVEVPVATLRYLGKNWPIGGGGYHRLLPGFASRYLARSVMMYAPFVFYCHPYELDTVEFKEIPIKIPLSIRLHQGLGRRWFTRRVQSFLSRFGGRRMEDLLSARVWPDFDLGAMNTPRP